MTSVNIDVRSFEVIEKGMSRSSIKDIMSFEQFYDHKAEKKMRQNLIEQRKKMTKGNVRVFGYKHPKSMCLLTRMFLCLKDCIDNKPEQLAHSMNRFLLIKSEISL